MSAAKGKQSTTKREKAQEAAAGQEIPRGDKLVDAAKQEAAMHQKGGPLHGK
jgi:hypothetical protein